MIGGTSLDSQTRKEPREIKARKATYAGSIRETEICYFFYCWSVGYSRESRGPCPLWPNQLSRFPGRAIPRTSRQEFPVKKKKKHDPRYVHTIYQGSNSWSRTYKHNIIKVEEKYPLSKDENSRFRLTNPSPRKT